MNNTGHRISEDELIAALGRPFELNEVGPPFGEEYIELTDTPDELWVVDTEEEAKTRLLARIAERAADVSRIDFAVWPETGTRTADGRAAGYTRAKFVANG